MPETRAGGRRIALFGGSFNPPHVCHTLAAAWALQALPIDEVWWMPTWSHAFGKDLLPFEDRVAMVQATIRPFESSMAVTEIEGELGGVSRTIHSVEGLRARFPTHEFSLLVGADIVDQIPSWKDADRLRTLVEIYVIGREGYQDPSTHDLRLPDISSTALRAAIREGDTKFYRPRMARDVVHMIEQGQWYRS